MKKIILLVAALSFLACAKNGHNGINGRNGEPGLTGPIGSPGLVGPTGATGPTGNPGQDSLSLGIICDVHNVPSWDNSTNLPQVFINNPTLGSFILDNFSVPDSQSSQGFPGMPSVLQNQVGLEGYGLDCAGYIYVATSGDYKFKLLSDDGSRLVVEDAVLIENQGLHAPKTVTANNVRLNKGLNRINIQYYQGPHTQIALELKWSGPNLTEQVVPALNFVHYSFGE